MSTTPTLLDLIDAYAEARHTNGDSTYNATTKAARDAVVAALTQGAGAVEPFAYAVECYPHRADIFKGETAYEFREQGDPKDAIFTAQQLQEAVARALAPIQQAIRDYHYALDTRQHGDLALHNAYNEISQHLGMHWQQGKEAAIRAKGTQ